jgi:hypothetical protein
MSHFFFVFSSSALTVLTMPRAESVMGSMYCPSSPLLRIFSRYVTARRMQQSEGRYVS